MRHAYRFGPAEVDFYLDMQPDFPATLPAGPVHYVSWVGVRPGFRQRGAATRALAAVCKEADAEGASLWLWAEPDQGDDGPTVDVLLRMYERAGFRVVFRERGLGMVRLPHQS